MNGHPKNSKSWSEFEKEWFIEECGAWRYSDEWESYDFSWFEAIDWARWDVKPGDANRYRTNGVLNPPEFVLEFASIGIDEAMLWVNEGFDLVEAVCWYLWEVDPKTAARHRDKGVLEAPDERFIWEGLTLEEAFQWVKEGFEDFDDAAEWIEWKVSPKNAIKYKDAGKELPDEEFREAGLSFEDAMKWYEHGFYSYGDEDSQIEDGNYWKNWYDAGLNPNQAANLRTELFEFIEKQFEKGTRARQVSIRYWNPLQSKESDLSDIAHECLLTLVELAAAGMKMNAENLVKWRGFSAERITATIDYGLGPDDAELAWELNIHPNQLELYEKIKAVEDIFMDSNYAKFLLNAGITEKQFQYLLKKGFRLTRIAEAIKIDSMTIDTIIKWAKAGWQVDVIEKDEHGNQQSLLGPWIETKLDPETAYRWKTNYFSAYACEKWIRAGVTDPEIAKRRFRAGIKPKS